MNFNDNPEELKKEEQVVLDNLISRMNRILKRLDQNMQNYVAEAKNADISINPDLYLKQLLARQGMKDTTANRKKFLQARDELYDTRLLLEYKDAEGSGIKEIKVGLHSCMNGPEQFVTSWKMPICRHYILDNASTEYESIVEGKHGAEYHTNYRLLVKNQITLRFTRVVKALNTYPGIFDDKTLKTIKGTGFINDAYLDKMIKRFNPDDYNPDVAAKIISDEFLQELLERRSAPEFKNIVFSIQKKQGEIIQAPYNRNMVVQGCAGSGKSMIMLHRLPILLYDHPDSLKRTNLYIITPSPMYIQLAEKMRHQLEISDIQMGTLEQYFDYCISKYPGHKAGEYGKINNGFKITPEIEQYIYSGKCVADICNYYDSIGNKEESLEKAYSIFAIKENENRSFDTQMQRINNRLLKLQKVINANNEILLVYFKRIKEVIDSMNSLQMTLRNRKSEVSREIALQISKNKEVIIKAQKELEKLDPEENEIKVNNRNSKIKSAQVRIEQLEAEMSAVETDDEYFLSLTGLSKKVLSVLNSFAAIKNEFSQNTVENIYEAIGRTGQLIGGFYMLSWEFSKVDDKYSIYLKEMNKDVEKVQSCVSVLQATREKYLDLEYFVRIKKEQETLSDASKNAISNAYEMVMRKLGIEPSENGMIDAVRCSPYIYLQVIYCYQGAPSSRESLIAIDEAQGIAPEEIRLLKSVNGNKVVFNMYGDVYQHIEGTKGIDNWNEYKEIIDFDEYQMLENYRNASQITEYCNRVFGMSMNPINTPGKGVHELNYYAEFRSEMITQLMDTQRAGLAAVLVSNDAEARYLLDSFSGYKQKFHDMTTENEFNMHRTRWNIINIDDAKGLEFSSVIALTGRMSRNEKYIAFTRALDDLYIYPGIIDITGFEKKTSEKSNKNADSEIQDKKKVEKVVAAVKTDKRKHSSIKDEKNYMNSEVRKFFEDNGLEVIDNREQGGRLWIIGEKSTIRNIVNEAISKFGISGKYASGKESKNRNGWYTKTDK